MNTGDRFGKYQLTRQLGGGAMGVVWAAINEDTHKEVALKLLPSPSDELRRRLLREAKACGRLDHRNIVAIYDTGTTPQGEPFLVMQLLSGETLGSRLRRAGRLSPEIAAAIGAGVAAGLAAAHAENIVHRDLKPENVFLHREAGGSGEVVKILDFGVSRVDLAGDAGATATGMLIGSPLYMSPEQARGSKLDPRSDIWSLGVVRFEMLTGARPFQGPSIAEAMAQLLTMPIPETTRMVPSVPAGLSAIVTACLVRELEQRPSRARRRGVAAPLRHDRKRATEPGRFPSVAPGPATVAWEEAPVPSAVASTSGSAAEPSQDVPEPAMVVPPEGSRSTTGELRLNSLPLSRVLVDGRPLGSTPKVGVTVSAGSHTVVFVYPTGERHTKSISVLPGTSEPVTDRLPSAPAPASAPAAAVPGAGF